MAVRAWRWVRTADRHHHAPWLQQRTAFPGWSVAPGACVGYEKHMSEPRVLLDAAAFMDSAHALRIDSACTEDIRTIAQRFLQTCYEDLGKAPRQLHGDELLTLLGQLLPRHFGTKDKLAKAVPDVLRAYVQHLDDTGMLSHRYELQQAIETGAEPFLAAVQSGAAHAQGIAVTDKSKPFVHRAEKTGRNDPCPCGSGKKLKKCCGR